MYQLSIDLIPNFISEIYVIMAAWRTDNPPVPFANSTDNLLSDVLLVIYTDIDILIVQSCIIQPFKSCDQPYKFTCECNFSLCLLAAFPIFFFCNFFFRRAIA